MGSGKISLTTISITKDGFQQEIGGEEYPVDNDCFVLEKGTTYLLYSEIAEVRRKKRVVSLEYLSQDRVVRAIFEPVDDDAERETHFIKTEDVNWMNRKEGS